MYTVQADIEVYRPNEAEDGFEEAVTVNIIGHFHDDGEMESWGLDGQQDIELTEIEKERACDALYERS